MQENKDLIKEIKKKFCHIHFKKYEENGEEIIYVNSGVVREHSSLE